MNSSRKGDETEATVLARLMDLGVTVAVPFGDSDRYDLIADDGRRRHRVQCKTGSWMNGTVRFNLYTSTVGSESRTHAEYTPEEIDAFAVYSERTDEVYWVPVEETGTGECVFASTTLIRRPRRRGSGGRQTTGSRTGSAESEHVPRQRSSFGEETDTA